MNENESTLKKRRHKSKHIVIILTATTLIVFTIAFLYHFLYPALLLGGFFDNPPNKSQVMLLLNDNKDTFENAVDCIRTLDSKVFRIDDAAKSYLSNGDDADTRIENEALDKILKLGIKDINIYENSIDFFCGGAGREYYTGIIYSDNGNPVSFEGDTSMTLKEKGNGWEWKEENGDNHYYCEKIEGNWYYYQMWF